MNTLADRVRAARAAAGMSQPEAALAAGIGLTTLRDIEQGRQANPGVVTVQHLERVLGAQLYVHADDASDSAASDGTNHNDQSPTASSARESAAGLR